MATRAKSMRDRIRFIWFVSFRHKGTATKQYSQAFFARLYEMVGLVYEMRHHISLSTQQGDDFSLQIGNLDDIGAAVVGMENAQFAT